MNKYIIVGIVLILIIYILAIVMTILYFYNQGTFEKLNLFAGNTTPVKELEDTMKHIITNIPEPIKIDWFNETDIYCNKSLMGEKSRCHDVFKIN